MIVLDGERDNDDENDEDDNHQFLIQLNEFDEVDCGNLNEGDNLMMIKLNGWCEGKG